MLDISRLESSLWEAADQLRANSKLNATEYSMPVLGLIFLRHATNRFEMVKAEIEATLPSRGGKKRSLNADDFKGKAAIYLPEEARYDYLLSLPEGADLGLAINEAMKAVEALSSMLQGVLPKEYAVFDPDLLKDLVRIFGRDELKRATGDVFGRIYEYFLNKFAMSGAQEGGEFFTPPSLVKMIVNVIEPTRGVVFDPASGSAGMFVQTGHFLEMQGANPTEKITFFGQEKSETNTRLAKMNLAVHGLDGQIQLGNTFYDFREDLVEKCDFVMSNPPFNVDLVSPDKVKSDPRLFTKKKIPGISAKTKTVSNANYLWIQYFYRYLNENGRAGFVMASSASDAGHGEKEIREELIATGAIDVMISIGTNFFYTRSLPCTLWFFDRGKPKAWRDQTLMIDARSVYRVISRKIRDFSEEQLQNLSAIVWLYRGEQHRYLSLVRQYLTRTYAEARQIEAVVLSLDAPVAIVLEQLKQFAAQVELTEEITIEDITTLKLSLEELEAAAQSFQTDRSEVLKALKQQIAGFAEVDLATNAAQRSQADRFAELVPALKGLQKHIAEVHKMVGRSLEIAEKQLALRRWEAWDSKAVRTVREQLEQARDQVIAVLKSTLYFKQQVAWLQVRFPEAIFVDVPGLCRVVSQDEIVQQDSSLTPGRYVGVGTVAAEDDEMEFEERMREIHLELAELNESAIELASAISTSFKEMTL